MTFNYPQICQSFLKDLPERQKELILRRFGLVTGQRETLESIGKSYGITRERVRQIEADGMNRLKRPEILRITSPLFDYFQDYLKRQGGLKREDILLENLGKDKFKPQVFFLLILGESFFGYKETKEFYPFWTINQELIPFFQKLINETIEIFQKELKPLLKKEFLEVKLKDSKISLEKKIDSQFVLSSLEISKKIEENPFGEIGLVNWPEINPRGVKDRAYLVLKKEKKPLHFQEITEKINQLKFYSEKPTLIQTVHNELIKDQRFVLVGRGIYALGEWGYEPGQVKDVIFKILRETEKPLTKEEILGKVLKQRMVKENTILLNLANKKYFLKNPQGKYQIKEI
jgi:hypothetical protein